MIAYVETSAAAKLLFREPESLPLKRQLEGLAADGVELYSCHLLETELRRSALRVGGPQELVTGVLAEFSLIELDHSIYREAGLMPGESLRSLDALHLAVARRIGTDEFFTYDQRQADAARSVGLRVSSPDWADGGGPADPSAAPSPA